MLNKDEKKTHFALYRFMASLMDSSTKLAQTE